jgi:nitric oxide reductase large subunit
MIEYGPDVNNSKALVASLNIRKNVRWFPMMSRKDIMTGLSLCDIGTGDFHMGSIYGGVNYEVLAMAKPFLHFRNDNYYKDYGHELYPLMNAKTADDITSALVDYKKRPDFFKEMGEQGRKWLQKYAIDMPLDRYLSIINEQL